MVIGQALSQKSTHVPFAQDDNAVKTLLTDGANHAFRVRVLPRRTRCRWPINGAVGPQNSCDYREMVLRESLRQRTPSNLPVANH